MNTNKVTGFDKISKKILFDLPRITLKIIMIIVKDNLPLEYFPLHRKISWITDLSIKSKAFEYILITKLNKILSEKRCIIPNHQFGSRKKNIVQSVKLTD